MRYSALLSFVDTTDFGPYQVTLRETTRVEARLPDEAIYALELYIYSLKPPHESPPVAALFRLSMRLV